MILVESQQGDLNKVHFCIHKLCLLVEFDRQVVIPSFLLAAVSERGGPWRETKKLIESIFQSGQIRYR